MSVCEVKITVENELSVQMEIDRHVICRSEYKCFLFVFVIRSQVYNRNAECGIDIKLLL